MSDLISSTVDACFIPVPVNRLHKRALLSLMPDFDRDDS